MSILIDTLEGIVRESAAPDVAVTREEWDAALDRVYGKEQESQPQGLIVRGRVGKYMIESSADDTVAHARQYGNPYANPKVFKGTGAQAQATEWAGEN